MGVKGRNMRTKIITAVIIVLFASLAIYSYTTQENKLHLQQVELKSRETKLKSLDLKYRTLNTELDKLKEDKNASDEQVKKLEEQRQQLEKEKQDLNQQLQAKLEEKSKLAQASEKVVNTVTQTQTASAAPVVSGNIQQIIVDAANRYGVSSTRLLDIAKCESTFSPTVVNHSYVAPDGTSPTGLFQYVGSTWRSFSSQAGYGGASIFDATAQANVTAWAFAHGYSSHWECKA